MCPRRQIQTHFEKRRRGVVRSIVMPFCGHPLGIDLGRGCTADVSGCYFILASCVRLSLRGYPRRCWIGGASTERLRPAVRQSILCALLAVRCLSRFTVADTRSSCRARFAVDKRQGY